MEYTCCKGGLFAKIDRITPESQTKAERTVELVPLVSPLGIPFGDHVRYAFTTQPNLTIG